jgi:hypothetical protein
MDPDVSKWSNCDTNGVGEIALVVKNEHEVLGLVNQVY